jgi:AcrR family transcriptional regulator
MCLAGYKTGMGQVVARRSQATRRADTQSKILEAAVDVLVERGYAGTTTTEICRKAGVSQGALFRYWSTKGELLAATSAHVFDRILVEYAEMFQEAQGCGQSPIELGIDLLWNIYHQRYMQARTELLVGARTDSEVAVALAALEPAHIGELSTMTRKLFPDIAAARPDFVDLVLAVIWAVQGASMGTAVLPVHAEEARLSLRRSLLAVAEALLGPADADLLATPAPFDLNLAVDRIAPPVLGLVQK